MADETLEELCKESFCLSTFADMKEPGQAALYCKLTIRELFIADHLVKME